MQGNPAQAMKQRMRDDLRAAMKTGRSDDARVIRSLIAALDNAEAPPVATGDNNGQQHSFEAGTAETGRLDLTQAQVKAILSAETHEREQAAMEMERLAQMERAKTLRAEVRLAAQYLEP